jgi:hypothetical protein
VTGHDRLSPYQRRVLEAWLPGADVVRDRSWPIGSTVLELEHDGRRYVLKAGDDQDGQIAQEITAHRTWLAPWTSRDRAPRLVHADEDARLLLTGYLPGELVEGRDEEHRPDTYRQAGELLALLHGQVGVDDDGFASRVRATTLRRLDGPHRIAPEAVARLRPEVEAWPTSVVRVVPTHGDYQPRNWVVHDGVVSVIDFGKTELRLSETDFTRLAAQQFRADPALESAFLDGYGSDPRDPATWRRERIRAAVGTAAWAHQVGDEAFEAQGLRMIAEL